MDLEENIRIAATMQANKFYLEGSENHGLIENGFISGAKSQAAKDYWYNEFKKELWKDNFQKSLFNDKSSHVMVNGTINGDEPNGEELELWHKQVIEPTYLYDEFVEYRKAHQEEEISYREWADKYVHIVDKTQVEKDERSVNKKVFIIANGHDDSQSFANMAEHIILLKKRAGGQAMLVKNIPHIKSIVPISDVIPEPIISKQEFLKMHDKSVERSITEETYKESRAWDIKKEKKVSHKRNNKRK